MLSYFWSNPKNEIDYTAISDDEKTSLSEKLTEKISSYFSSVQTKGLLVTVSSAITLMGAYKLKGLGLAPTIVAGTGVGTPSVLTLTGTDTSGIITVTTGTAVASNNIVSVTFKTPFTTAPQIVFSPLNEISGTQISQVHVSSSVTGFSLVCSSTPLSNTSQYQWSYIVVQ